MARHLGAYSALHGPLGRSLVEYVEEQIPDLWSRANELIENVTNTGAEYVGEVETLDELVIDKLFFFTPHVNSQAAAELSLHNEAGTFVTPFFPILRGSGAAIGAGELIAGRRYILRSDGAGTVTSFRLFDSEVDMAAETSARIAADLVLTNGLAAEVLARTRMSTESLVTLTTFLKSTLTSGQAVFVKSGDGGDFRWDSASTAPVDGFLVLASDEGGAGRWIRKEQNLTPEKFGIVYDDSSAPVMSANVAAWAAMMAFIRASNIDRYDLGRNEIDVRGQRIYADASLDLGNLFLNRGSRVSNLKLISKATAGAAVDATNSRGVIGDNWQIRTQIEAVPDSGLLWSRPSTGEVAGDHDGRGLSIIGHFRQAALIMLSPEVSNWNSGFVQNGEQDTTAYTLMLLGNSGADTGNGELDLTFGGAKDAISTLYTPVSGVRSFQQATFNRFTFIRATTDPTMGGVLQHAITGISNANPALVSYDLMPGSTRHPENGEVWMIDRVNTGMVEINRRQVQVANVNTIARTFQCAGLDTSDPTPGTGFTPFTSGGNIYPKTGPLAAIVRTIGAKFNQCYEIVFGGACWDFFDTNREGFFGSHVEGVPFSLFQFWPSFLGGGVQTISHCVFHEYNSQSRDFIVSIVSDDDLDYVRFDSCIFLITGFNDPPQGLFFSHPEKCLFKKDSAVYCPTKAKMNEAGSFLQPPSLVVIADARQTIRRYGLVPSPAHIQVLDKCDQVFPEVNSVTPTRYIPAGWLARTGSSAGPVINLGNNNAGGYLRLIPGGGTDFSDFGVHLRTERIFSPALGDCMFEFSAALVVAAVAARRLVFGFESKVVTTGALADTDFPVVLDAVGAPTFDAQDGVFLAMDGTTTTNNFWLCSRKAGVTVGSIDLGAGPSGSEDRWRLFISLAGDAWVFYSSNNGLTWVGPPTVPGTNGAGFLPLAVNPAHAFFAVVASRIVTGTTARETTIRNIDVRCLQPE